MNSSVPARSERARSDEAGQVFHQLRLDGVTRRFGKTTAVNQLSLNISAGEFVAFLGPSGCGKSTALNCLAGLLSLSGGSIWLDERRIDHLPPERRGFGMVFQSYALFPHLNVRRNIGFGLAMHGVARKEIRRRVQAALELVQLEAHGDKLPARLSGGQQQRVAIARAIVIEPALILMDEPLSNLDAKLRTEMRSEIKRIHRDLQRTTVYVTHDQDEALSLADRIVVLHDGCIQQIGKPEVLYQNPTNLRVARFMGFRNVFKFDLERQESDRVSLIRPGLRLEGVAQETLSSRQVIAAIRPDDICVQEASDLTSSYPVNTFSACTGLVEYSGRDYLVTLSAEPDLVLQARTSKRFALGDQLTLSVNPARVLVFSSE